MLQAITTKYLGPTARTGSRIKAQGASKVGQSLTVPYDHAGNSDARHCAAAIGLAMNLNWSGLWVGGGLNEAGDRVWVNLPITRQQIAGHTLDRHPLGTEGADWFFLADQRA